MLNVNSSQSSAESTLVDVTPTENNQPQNRTSQKKRQEDFGLATFPQKTNNGNIATAFDKSCEASSDLTDIRRAVKERLAAINNVEQAMDEVGRVASSKNGKYADVRQVLKTHEIQNPTIKKLAIHNAAIFFKLRDSKQ